MTANDISCEHPRFIVHPNLAELVCRYHYYTLNGVEYFYKYNYRGLVCFDYRVFWEFLPQVNFDTIDNFFVTNKQTGETFPVYLAVPCNHCSLCEETKANAFVHRCRLESQCYDCNPYFFTLTYDNEHLPEDGVSVRDVQLFMKRFRINLLRHGFFFPIRYCIVSEYGPRTHRAHYHGIIWNLQPSVMCDLLHIKKIMQSSWGNGEVRRPRFVDPVNDKCFYYTTKYMTKSPYAPAEKNEVFMLSSRGKGGIGAHYLDKIAPEFRRCLTPDFKINDKFSAKQTPLVMSHYVLNRLLPSFCRSVPSDLRKSVRTFMQDYADGMLRDETTTVMLYSSTYEKIIEKFKDKFYFGVIDGAEHCIDGRTDEQVFGELSECRDIILKYLDAPPDFSKAYELADKRTLFLGRMLKAVKRQPLSMRISRARLHRSRLKSSSVL